MRCGYVVLVGVEVSDQTSGFMATPGEHVVVACRETLAAVV